MSLPIYQPTCVIALHKEFVAFVYFAEFLGCVSFIFLKDTVEVGDVVKTGAEADVSDGGRG